MSFWLKFIIVAKKVGRRRQLTDISLSCGTLIAKTCHLTSVDLTWPHAWIRTPNKATSSQVLLHIEALKHTNDAMKDVSPVSSESELIFSPLA